MTDVSQNLPAILEAHRKWVFGEEGGVRANLYGANLDGANLVRANLDGANLDGANLVRANLDGANLVRANLYGANLVRANLVRANLYGAKLVRANLDGANLYGANLVRANLDGANLYGAKLREGIIIHRRPLQIAGLPYRVTIWDAHMEIGCQFHRLSEWEAFDNEAIAKMDGVKARKFWDAWKAPLLAMARADERDFSPAAVEAEAAA